MSWMALLMISAVTLSLTSRWLGLEVRRAADDLLEVLPGAVAPGAQERQRVLRGAGVVAEGPGLEVGDKLGGLVDDGDGPDDQPHGSEC